MTGFFAPPTAPAAWTPFEQTCAAPAASAKPDSERLQELFQAAWDYQMREYPESATYSGYPGYNDRWTDLSLKAIERSKHELHAPLQALLSIKRERLNMAKGCRSRTGRK